LLDVLPAVYDQLRAIARRHLRREQAGHTLQTTAVLHEAYLRLAQDGSRPYADRAEFCVAAARAIRRVLIDHARGRKALKRGGGVAVRVDLDSSLLCTAKPGVDPLELEEALNRLAALSSRQARVVELRFFGGLSEEETAEALGVSRRTVQEDWRFARAWLLREMGGDEHPGTGRHQP